MTLWIRDWPTGSQKLQKECAMETPDDAEANALHGLDGFSAEELSAVLRAADDPPTALTAEQQITLKCMEIVGEDMSPAGLSPKGEKLFRDTVEYLITRVTTGNWPDDTNGTTE